MLVSKYTIIYVISDYSLEFISNFFHSLKIALNIYLYFVITSKITSPNSCFLHTIIPLVLLLVSFLPLLIIIGVIIPASLYILNMIQPPSSLLL